MCDLSVERSIAAHFAVLNDPRCDIQRRHTLIEMIIIAIAATLSGADGWVAIEAFAKAKEAWLRSFLELPYGIPSHDCFGRVFGPGQSHQASLIFDLADIWSIYDHFAAFDSFLDTFRLGANARSRARNAVERLGQATKWSKRREYLV